MAPSASLVFLRRCLLAVLLCVAVPCCMSDGGPEDIVTRALACFSDHRVYIACESSYRLGAEGLINVPLGAADAYCGGPCLAETNLVLKCIDGILHNFRFYNGASLRDIRYAIHRGCGHGGRRGDFSVAERTVGGGYGYGGYYLGDEYDDDYDFDAGNMLVVSLTVVVMLISSCALLLWVF